MSDFYLLKHRLKSPNWYASRRNPLRLIVVHITAGLEDLDGADASAEKTARYAATTDRKVSWHSGSDADSWLNLLPADYTAWHCYGYNSIGYGHEISKTTVRWADMPAAWVDGTLRNAAEALAPIVRQYRIPLVRLTRAQVDDGEQGFAAHADLDPTRRSDPGADFPWARLFALIDAINNPPLPALPPEVAMYVLFDGKMHGQYLCTHNSKRRIDGEESAVHKAAGTPFVGAQVTATVRETVLALLPTVTL